MAQMPIESTKKTTIAMLAIGPDKGNILVVSFDWVTPTDPNTMPTTANMTATTQRKMNTAQVASSGTIQATMNSSAWIIAKTTHNRPIIFWLVVSGVIMLDR